MKNSRLFHDREDAGRSLAPALGRSALRQPLVLGLPRGGVPVAVELSRALDTDMDILVVRKLGVPYQPELAFGAIASGGVRVFNDDVLILLPELDDETIDAIIGRESPELARRETTLRGNRPRPAYANRDVVLVDDGLATGATMRAAIQAVRRGNPRRVLVAVPIGSPQAVRRISEEADDVICLNTPASFTAVGSYYERFEQTTDEDVRRILGRRWREQQENGRTAAGS